MMTPNQSAAANPASRQGWQSMRPVGRVAELLSLGHFHTMTKFDASQIQWRVPWWPVPAEHDAGTIAELHREMPAGHVLFGRTVQTVGRRQDCDDVLFYLGESAPQFAVVHLTYARETNPEWPNTTLYDSLQSWMERCMIPDAQDFET